MTNKQPALSKYLFNAYYSWLVDTGAARVHVYADHTHSDAVIPFATTDQPVTVISVGMQACPSFSTNDDGISGAITTRGRHMDFFVPWDAVISIHDPARPPVTAPPLSNTYLTKEDYEAISQREMNIAARIRTELDLGRGLTKPIMIIPDSSDIDFQTVLRDTLEGSYIGKDAEKLITLGVPGLTPLCVRQDVLSALIQAVMKMARLSPEGRTIRFDDLQELPAICLAVYALVEQMSETLGKKSEDLRVHDVETCVGLIGLSNADMVPPQPTVTRYKEVLHFGKPPLYCLPNVYDKALDIVMNKVHLRSIDPFECMYNVIEFLSIGNNVDPKDITVRDVDGYADRVCYAVLQDTKPEGLPSAEVLTMIALRMVLVDGNDMRHMHANYTSICNKILNIVKFIADVNEVSPDKITSAMVVEHWERALSVQNIVGDAGVDLSYDKDFRKIQQNTWLFARQHAARAVSDNLNPESLKLQLTIARRIIDAAAAANEVDIGAVTPDMVRDCTIPARNMSSDAFPSTFTPESLESLSKRPGLNAGIIPLHLDGRPTPMDDGHRHAVRQTYVMGKNGYRKLEDGEKVEKTPAEHHREAVEAQRRKWDRDREAAARRSRMRIVED